MLEGLAAWVLNTYVGEYVENLNTDQLSIGLLQGEVELENLPLKKDALQKLDLPLEVKSGFIGRICLQIPRYLKSEPWVISMERLYIVAGPLPSQTYNEKKEKEKEAARKKQQLDALEAKWKSQKQTQTQEAASYSWWSYGTNFAANIIENLQLKVKDVHIRYEDNVTIPGCSFACGLVIKSLSAQSTDGTWIPKFVSRNSTDMMRKLLDLQNFSVYWDTDAALVGHLPMDELADALQREMGQSAKTQEFKEHDFILEPVSLQAKMKRNTSALALRSPSSPRITLDLQLEEIPLTLSDAQYRGFVAWLKELERFDKGRKFLKWRPTCTIKDHARKWWRSMIEYTRAGIHERHKRFTRDYMVQRAKDNVRYVAAYSEYLTKGSYMSAQLKEHMEKMESEWTFEELKTVRQVAMDRVMEAERLEEAARQAEAAEQQQQYNQDQQADQDVPANKGLFRSWFPGWGGWYGSSSTDIATDTISPPPGSSTEESTGADREAEIEQEIMDVLADSAENNTLLKRDTVFAQLNFSLKSGTFKLLSTDTGQTKPDPGGRQSCCTILELECTSIQMVLESRPRTNGLKFGISVGGLYLRDRMTAGSILPVLIAPQNKERLSGQSRQVFSGVLGGPAKSSLFHTASKLGASTMSHDETLFELVYEKKPAHSLADYRLQIKTKPLDIVYNPTAIRRVQEFFAVRKSAAGSTSRSAELQVAVAARSRYEALKKQTAAELRQTLDELLETDSKIKAKRWDIHMDVSAPQIIIPENFCDQNTVMVVFDLGHLQFMNSGAGLQKRPINRDVSEDESDFVTPSSTPPSEDQTLDGSTEQASAQLSDIADMTEDVLREKIYDKYTLDLSELQVMVGRAKDNWRHAHNKGTSHLHVIDKFSISIQFERRLIYTSDPQWPRITLAGNLPSLVLHVNEQKIQALRTCSSLVSDPGPGSPEDSTNSGHSTDRSSEDTSAGTLSRGAYLSKSILSVAETIDNQTRQALAESRQILMQFSINQVSLEVQSRGRSIAELQVSGVRANFTKRPYDTSVALTVHSLLVVDALQTFGPDYELLVASHKNLCLDSRSGSIRGSDPNSPVSPQSPTSPSSPGEFESSQQMGMTSLSSVQSAFSTALQSLMASRKGTSTSPDGSVSSPFLSTQSPPSGGQNPPLIPFLAPVDTEALITVELEMISPNCPSNSSEDETLQIASIQFNNLDIIANQQTIVELLGFFKRVSPTSSDKNIKSRKESDNAEMVREYIQMTSTRTEVTADFHRLNILLMRGDERDHEVIARKVATATMMGAKIQATLAGDLEVHGSLGGLQLLDLRPEGIKHQKVFCVGMEPGTHPSFADFLTFTPPKVDMYKTATQSMLVDMDDEEEEDDSGLERAFKFFFKKPLSDGKTPTGSPSLVELAHTDDFGASTGVDIIDVNIRMGSLCYTHSPMFLKEVSLCANEFQEYMATVATSLKYAATEVAMGLVHKRSDLMAASMYGSNVSLDSPFGTMKKRRQSTATVETQEETQFDITDTMEDTGNSFSLRIDAVLQTPIILIPRTPDSSEVFAVQLGKISINNENISATGSGVNKESQSFQYAVPKSKDKIFMEIRDMSVYSTKLDNQKGRMGGCFDGKGGKSAFRTGQPGRLPQINYGTPILHDTVIELSIEKIEPSNMYINRSGVGDIFMGEDLPWQKDESASQQTVIQMEGKIATPLRLVLSKHVYEQLLQTVDHLTPADYENANKSSPPLEDVPEETENSLHPSMSALKLDQGSLHSITSPRDKPASESLDSKDDGDMKIKAKFEIPVFSVEMRGDFGEGEQGLVDIKFQDFKVWYEKGDKDTTSIEVTLQNLVVDDLLQDENSKHRHLMVSTPPSQPKKAASSRTKPSAYLSTSCPSNNIDIPAPHMPHSLPSSLQQLHMFEEHVPVAKPHTTAKTTGRAKHLGSECPCTPPPSRVFSRRTSTDKNAEEALVHIKVLLVDKKSPEYATKYNRTNRFVDVDFNCLDTTINLQTWVVVLDFLGMGAKVHDLENFTLEAQLTHSASWPNNLYGVTAADFGEVINTEIELKVQSLSLILNKPEYELARANVSKMGAHISLRDDNMTVQGQLGSMSLQDQSPHGLLYRERFVTVGQQALSFDIFKYGSPDPDLLRAYDIGVKIRMGSVRYVHTQRFVQESLAFIQHFNQLQDVLGRMRAASAGKKISETAFRGARVSMDIEAGAPVILIPHSSRSTDILVANLGTLSIHNTFLFADTEGTISWKKKQEKARAGSDASTTSSRSSDTVGTSRGNDAGLESSQNMENELRGGEAPSADRMGDTSLMTGSVYGSLDSDWRSMQLESVRSLGCLESVNSESFRSATGDLANRRPSSLSSFHSLESSGSHRESTAERRQQFAAAGESVTGASTAGINPKAHKCLLDVFNVNLVEMDLFSAEWQGIADMNGCHDNQQNLIFPSYVVKRDGGRLLKETCRLDLQVERNLEGDISHSSPDLKVNGMLSAVHCSLDLKQYKLIKGLLDHNLGEPLEEFKGPLLSHLMDPTIQTVLSGDVWQAVIINIDLLNVTLELLINHEQLNCPETSLARLDFVKSRLCFETFSDQSKDVDLVSHEIVAHDTRYRDAPVNTRPNVFSNILQPIKDRSCPSSLQMELHYRSNKDFTCFTILLNNMRLMGIFDWLLAVQDFLMTSVDNPFKKEGEELEKEEKSDPIQRASSPLVVSGGIATKRAPIMEKTETPFELKLNVTDTELVVVEDMSAWDTNAVILKSTAVLQFSPTNTERPLSCSLQSLEVFSCSLAAEDETALSIIDPMIVTIELNGNPVTHKRATVSSGLLDVPNMEELPPLLEISFSSLNIRLSYNDMKLFMAILNSVPKQALQAKNQPPKNAPTAPKFAAAKIAKLRDLGFSEADCECALVESQGHLDDAALWLTHNASPVKPQQQKKLQFSGFELKAGTISVCLIDDCQDADVPLAELTFSSVYILQKLQTHMEGKANFKFSGDYYNRALSGWEPFIETWGCQVDWDQMAALEGEKLAVHIKATEPMNINLTSNLLQLYDQTKQKWTEDYYNTEMERSPTGALVASHRRRVPFVPFAVRNHTGRGLWFATLTTLPTRVSPSTAGNQAGLRERADSQHKVSEWRQVMSGDEISFMFEEREKIRHKHTHELKVHQLVVKVDGWKDVAPVSMDRVGTYFRQARPEIDTSSSIFTEIPDARIVFDVTLEGSARKVITVRSALVVVNQLEDEVELKLENTQPGGRDTFIKIDSKAQKAIPIQCISSKMWARPLAWSVDFCNKPIFWHYVTRPGEINDGIRLCDTKFGEEGTYRFCVSVHRQNYPVDLPSKVQPGHKITLVPPVRLVNLLPVDMTYYLKNTDIKGSIKPGKSSALFSADLSQPLELGVRVENFPSCKELVIPPGTQDYQVKLRVYDLRNRLLELIIRIHAIKGGALKLSVSAPYWLVNKSGLPLIFKQDGSNKETAGQFEEHELARSVTPLLFSFADKEANFTTVMRVGKSVHGASSYPQWCHGFPLDSGVGMRPVHVRPKDNSRIDWVYNIGIEVRQGRGRYRDTNIVTFSPLYQLDNQSGHKLAFAQLHAAKGHNGRDTEGHLSALPTCKLSFHWPRVDLDQLLCVRMMDKPHCRWSGGFRIDIINSFHINMRGENSECLFLRVDVVLHGATFFIVFTDAHDMPPPYRIDNFAEVQVMYFQTKVVDNWQRTSIKPMTSSLQNRQVCSLEHSTSRSQRLLDVRAAKNTRVCIVGPDTQTSYVAYAWDEPTQPPHITLSLLGGTSATYNMDVIADGDQLCYENFIYIAFTATFMGGAAVMHMTGIWPELGAGRESMELVLDMGPGNHLVLNKKEPGKRSQLWRMTSSGMLQHEGSKAPQDPRKPSFKVGITYVLDIADIAPRPGTFAALTLRKPDERRRSTQTWRFTEDGRLCCGLGLYVQSRDGGLGLYPGAEAVLGVAPPIKSAKDVPPEMAIHRQKMKPGSGILAVKVITDGPTRVLQITDIRHQRMRQSVQHNVPGTTGDWAVIEPASKKPKILAEMDSESESISRQRDLEVTLQLAGGIGLSLINHVPEEIAYISLQGIVVDYNCLSVGETLEASIANIQVDNQLFGTQWPVLLFVTPSSKKDKPDTKPALQISAHKMPNNDRWNADIYKHLMISLKKTTVLIDEKLLWKLIQFATYTMDMELEHLDESSFDTQRALTLVTSAQAKRYYFGTLKLSTSSINLSMLTTAGSLTPDLQAIKRSMGIPLIRFEDATVELEPFAQVHPFETGAFLVKLIQIHYTEELKSQAAKILGSVDFLGNPLGLFNDVTEGISGLIKDGNIGGLFKNVTHGVSNSAAKVTGSLSEGIGKATLDQKHQMARQEIMRQNTGSSTGHLVAGIKGLGHGLFGGITSIVTQTVSGAMNDGLEGIVTGFGRGVVGTVTKPVAGVLDFASGAASAVRDTSRTNNRHKVKPIRKPRCCYGPGGLLPPHSEHHAAAQEYLFTLNNKNYSEIFIAIEQLRFGQEDNLKVLISSQQVYFLGRDHPGKDIMLEVAYDELYFCQCIQRENKFYIQLTMKAVNQSGVPGPDPRKRPKVRCDSESIAQKVVQQIIYAKNLFDETNQTLHEDTGRHEDD